MGAKDPAACRGRSRAEFAARLGIFIEEADESGYWLELIIEGERLPETHVPPLLTEANERAAILVSGVKTTRENDQQS